MKFHFSDVFQLKRNSNELRREPNTFRNRSLYSSSLVTSRFPIREFPKNKNGDLQRLS